jgi:uncharacterized protein
MVGVRDPARTGLAGERLIPHRPVVRPARLGSRAALATTVVLLGAYHEARRLAIPDSWHFATNTAMIGVLGGLALAAGLDREELGLGAATWRRGLRAGGLVAGAVAAVVAVTGLAGLDPTGRIADAAALGGGTVAFQTLVEIPIATVAFEELAFRGVLDGLLARVTSPGRALALSSLLFGLWHVSPAAVVSGDAGSQFGTVAATAIAGAGFHLLRRRTGSLLAPAVAHWGTNGGALAVAWLVGR